MNPRFHLPSLAAALIVLTAPLAAQVTTTFDNTTSNNKGAYLIGWESYGGALAESFTNSDPNTTVSRIGLSNVLGAATATARGFLFSFSSTTSQNWAVLDTFEAFTPTTIAWQAGNSAISTEVRLMVQSAGAWYATETSFGTAALTLANFQNATGTGLTAESKSFDFAGSRAGGNWRAVALTPGAELSLGATGSVLTMLASDITGIGFYITHSASGTTARIDNLVMNGSTAAIPEPSTYSLILGAAALAVIGFRRRLG